EVDDVAGQFGAERPFDVGADFHVLAAGGGAEVGHAGHFRNEPDTSRAVDATVHRRLHQRAEVLVRHRALVFGVAGVVHAIAHGLVLQVALTALVADRAIQRMVDQQKFHYAAPGVADHLAVGMDDHAVGDRIGTGGDRLG